MKIVIIAGYAPSILIFRQALIKALQHYGEVVVLAPPTDETTANNIRALGVTYDPYFLDARGSNPLHDVKTLKALITLIKKHSPTIVLSYTMKPVIWGSIAAALSGVKCIYAMMTGLGYAFIEQNSLKATFIQKIVIRLAKIALAKNKVIFFQNPDDLAIFKEKHIFSSVQKTVMINGSGVDLAYYAYDKPKEEDSVRFLLIARLLKDKGLREYVAAAEILKTRYPTVECHLIGYFDDNPAAIQKQELDAWVKAKSIIFHGKCDDVRPFLREASVYVLPSYREGTPRSVLEAMAIGRAIVTTDAPGCRETVKDGYNGFLVPVRNVDALVVAMEKFIQDPSLITTMGLASRQYAEEKYDVHAVNDVILNAMEIKNAKTLV